jgi:hypothetical protein
MTNTFRRVPYAPAGVTFTPKRLCISPWISSM